MRLDDYERAFLELKFEVETLKRRGDSYQEFFCEIMSLRYPGDFIKTRPWGRQGDWKNDGYLRSQRQLFQCYAPDEIKDTVTIRKIDEDFDGALPHWQAYFETWTLVHNAHRGLPPAVTERLLRLNERISGLSVTDWGPTVLRQRTFELERVDLLRLLGAVPTRKQIAEVPFDALQVVLVAVERHLVEGPPDLRPVPSEKLSANALSPATVRLLQAGIGGSARLAAFFKQYHDPTIGDQVAARFRAEYLRLRESGHTPDDVFHQLQVFASGLDLRDTSRQAAVLVLLAYLFEQCDIFERPSA